MEEKCEIKTDLSSKKKMLKQTLQEKDREKQSILDSGGYHPLGTEFQEGRRTGWRG